MSAGRSHEIDNTFGRQGGQRRWPDMPWKKNEPMEQRIEFAMKALRSLNFRALCQEYGISAKTGYKWKERFLREGLAGMEEESRRPKSHSEQLPEEEVCEIVRLKLAHLSWGPRKIRELYLRRHGEVASESTFKRVLERAGPTKYGRWILRGGGEMGTNDVSL